MTSLVLTARSTHSSRDTALDLALPDFESLRALHHSWELEDRRPGGPLARYGRFLAWCRPDEQLDKGAADGVPRRCTDDLALAVTYFTARNAEPPDHAQWRTLAAAVAGVRGPNPYDVALAWATGWRGDGVRRQFTPGYVGELAVLALIEQVHASLQTSIRLLGERTGLAVVAAEETASLAASMGMSLLGVCDCGHHLRGCDGCGSSCCYPDHDLRTWDPDVCHLRPFVDQAVRGTAQRRILGGAFATGMLFRLLEREGRLLCRTVEWGCCEICGRSFEGVRCPEPHATLPRSIRREPRKNQLILPPLGNAGHVPMQRWWCAPCRHLFGAAGGAGRHRTAECPRCGAPATASKAVWTLTPAQPKASDWI